MSSRTSTAAFTLAFALLIGCRPDKPDTMFTDGGSQPGDLSASARDLAMSGHSDLASRPDLPIHSDGGPTPNPPPASCYQRKAGVTAIQSLITIDRYIGLQTGHSGTHEIAEGTVTTTAWIYDSSLFDTTNVQLAMVVDAAGPGLPMELPLLPGQVIETEGEYIPSATADATTAKGPAAVIHFTHSPCGYAIISGMTYQ